jgi:hypothetical protein
MNIVRNCCSLKVHHFVAVLQNTVGKIFRCSSFEVTGVVAADVKEPKAMMSRPVRAGDLPVILAP